MMRNNGSRGLGMTTDEMYWLFDNGSAGKLGVSKLIFTNLGDSQLAYLESNGNDQSVYVQTIEVDKDTIPIIAAVQGVFENTPDNLIPFTKTIDSILKQDTISTQVLEHIDNLAMTNTDERIRVETQIIDNEVDLNNWKVVKFYMEKLERLDHEMFGHKRNEILKTVAEIIDDPTGVEWTQVDVLRELLERFDLNQSYLPELVKVQMKLGDFFEARITCLTKLDQETRQPLLDEMLAAEKQLSHEAYQAVQAENIDFFKTNPNNADVLLDGGFLPVEYAVFLQKSPKFVDKLKDYTDKRYLKYSGNSFQLSWDMLAANRQDLKYFIKVTQHDSRPTDYIMSTGRSLAIDARTNSIQAKKKALREGKYDDIDQIAEEEVDLSAARQRQHNAQMELERKQAGWDAEMRTRLSESFVRFYRHLHVIDEETVRDNLQVHYVEDEDKLKSEAQTVIDQSQKRVDELTAQNENIITYLVDQAYSANPLERTEFEESKDFKLRVTDYKKRLLEDAKENSADKTNKNKNEITALESQIHEKQRYIASLKDRIRAENTMLNEAFDTWVATKPAEHFLNEVAINAAEYVKIGQYDADTYKFEYEFLGGNGHISVPIKIAQSFREDFSVQNVVGMQSYDNFIKIKYRFNNQEFVFPALKFLSEDDEE
ncbi:hypothetical protein [Lactiplantibacillus carotarum]|uniref:hypothetical protein n=1 Tax=Lactiplantibacillus carotarum TaxID=2993456 RepID=UPI00298ED906|nr:hypothetical protein [Lactiplantibacillus carotarum]